MKRSICFFTFLLSIFSSMALANDILMREVDARAIQKDHDATINFWSDEEAQKRHKFFDEVGGEGHRFGIRDLNLRAISLWQNLGECKNNLDGNVLARALMNLSQDCPNLVAPFQELNRNYIEFLVSTELSPHVVKLDTARKFGRVPLHPLLQQFSFNYYINVISALQFDEGIFNSHDIYKVLSLDIGALVAERKQHNDAAERAKAAWQEYIKDEGFWKNLMKSRKGPQVFEEHVARKSLSIDQRGERHRLYFNKQWNENYPYMLVFHRFLTNNFIMTVQNMIHQFPSNSCEGIGLYEYSNLSGILVHRLRNKSFVSYAAEEEFRNMILNFCNHRTHFKMKNWVQAWSNPGSDPLPEAIEISKFHRNFLLDSTLSSTASEGK